MSERNEPQAADQKRVEEQLSQETERRVCALADKFRKGAEVTSDELDGIENLQRLKALLPAQKATPTRQIDAVLLCVFVVLLAVMMIVRVPSTAVDVEVHATKIQMKLAPQKDVLDIPGEHGEILSLKQALIARADEIIPSTSVEDRNLDLREAKAAAGGAAKGVPCESFIDLGVRLQQISLPSNSSLSLVVGVAYSTQSRGLLFEPSSAEDSVAKFAEVTPATVDCKNSATPPYFRPYRVSGKEMSLELFPSDQAGELTVFRDLHVVEITFMDGENSSILSGALHVRNSAQATMTLQPSDRLMLQSRNSIVVRELVLSKGELKALVSVPRATAIQYGEDTWQDAMPTLLEWVHFRWPTELYAALSALVGLWLAARRWWGGNA